MTYYYIKKIGLLARLEPDGMTHKIYDAERRWVEDIWSIVDDYLMGYDSSEEPGSPYRFGNGAIMSNIREVTEEQAEKVMHGYKFCLGDNPRKWNP